MTGSAAGNTSHGQMTVGGNRQADTRQPQQRGDLGQRARIQLNRDGLLRTRQEQGDGLHQTLCLARFGCAFRSPPTRAPSKQATPTSHRPLPRSCGNHS